MLPVISIDIHFIFKESAQKKQKKVAKKIKGLVSAFLSFDQFEHTNLQFLEKM